MDNENAKKLLLSLLSERKKRTKISQIREIFDEIETALSSGVSRAIVVEKLNEAGIEISFSSFASALHVIRKEKNLAPKKNTPPPQAKNETLPEVKTDQTKQVSISEIKRQPVDLASLTREFKNLSKNGSHGNNKDES